MDLDNLNAETRLPDLIALWLESRRTAMEWPDSDALPLLPNAYASDLATPSVVINCLGYTPTKLIGQADFEIVVNFRNTTNDLGFTLAEEALYVSRMRREIGRKPTAALGFMGWLNAQSEAHRNYVSVEHFRHAGGAVQLVEEEHLRVRQTRVALCAFADEFSEPS